MFLFSFLLYVCIYHLLSWF